MLQKSAVHSLFTRIWDGGTFLVVVGVWPLA